jgi:hypothetical protein
VALHITNPKVETSVRRLAAQRGQSITEVIGVAVQELAKEPPQSRRRRPTVEEALAMIRSFPQVEIDYSLSEDEILGYGPHGYPE